ncbi:MAG: transposase [Deltaproteobacteria bacterium]|nr:transposase [Deltaproteobacteria bacterium]
MAYNPDIHHRRSNRLAGYDYSQGGVYFITICTDNKECLFGEIVNGHMMMNNLGKIVADEWIKTGTKRDNINLDDWVVMPNHFHGIVIIDNDMEQYPSVGAQRAVPLSGRFGCLVAGSLSTIIRSFKSAVTKQTNIIRQTPKLPLWQRNYWDHVVRDEADLNRIREYIHTNPQRWELDSLHRESK